MTFLFLKDQRTDRFYKLYKLTCTNTKLYHTTSTGTWHRGYGFFEVCQAEGRGFESRPWPKILCVGFFVFVRLFPQIFSMSPKGPLHFFYFAKEWMFKNFQRALFCIFWQYATYRRPKKWKKSENFLFFPHAGTVEENTWHFEVLLLFLSVRYGTDLARSRLVWNLCNISKTAVRKWNWLW